MCPTTKMLPLLSSVGIRKNSPPEPPSREEKAQLLPSEDSFVTKPSFFPLRPRCNAPMVVGKSDEELTPVKKNVPLKPSHGRCSANSLSAPRLVGAFRCWHVGRSGRTTDNNVTFRVQHHAVNAAFLLRASEVGSRQNLPVIATEPNEKRVPSKDSTMSERGIITGILGLHDAGCSRHVRR